MVTATDTVVVAPFAGTLVLGSMRVWNRLGKALVLEVKRPGTEIVTLRCHCPFPFLMARIAASSRLSSRSGYSAQTYL